jgi:hypothetical protein
MNAGFSNLDTLKRQLLANTLANDKRFDAVILALGQGVAAQFQNVTQRRFARIAGDTEVFPADRSEFILSRVPVEAVTLSEVKLRESDGWVVQTDPNFIYALDLVNGIINCGPSDVGPYYGQVRFTYTAGYFWETLEPDDASFPSALPTGASLIPADLLQAWFLQCRHLWALMDKTGAELLHNDAAKSLRFPDDYAPTVEKTLNQFIRYKLV